MGEDELAISKPTYLCLITVILIMATGTSGLYAQDPVLEQEVTIRITNVKRQSVLRSLSRQTAFTFTYDTELIKPQTIVSVSPGNSTLIKVLDEIFEGEDFGYSVIENHIIIYKKIDESTPVIEEKGKSPVYLITGSVIEASTSKPLPYATIGIYKQGLGTISNFDGAFTLKVPEFSFSDSLRISYLGFSDRLIPVAQAVNNHYIIELTRDYVPIPEVIIRTRKPQELVANIHKYIKQNYGSSPKNLKAFYRESVTKKDKIQLYSEAVLNIYKSAYTGTLLNDQLSVFKSRKIENIDSEDTLILKLQAGLDACLDLDGIKNTFDFIDPLHYEEYDYHMTDIVNIGDEAAYVVEFSQKEEVNDLPLFRGSIFINTDNYGVHSAEFEINQEHIEKLGSSFVKESSRHYSIKLRKVKYRVDYSYQNNQYTLSHVKGDLDFFARKKRKLFGSTYHIMFEMAVTGSDTINVERFTRDEKAQQHSIFAETISEYDYNFWGVDNFIQPEQNIQEAIKQINARLNVYKKD